MRIFYGGAIQGGEDRKETAALHRPLIEFLKKEGHEVCTEHTTSTNLEEAKEMLAASIGSLPSDELERRIFVRDKMIEFVESDIDLAIFEVSIPSLGTGIEIAHAYLRRRLGLKEIPIVALYKRFSWKNELSTMIRGLSQESAPSVHVLEYDDVEDAKKKLRGFLS